MADTPAGRLARVWRAVALFLAIYLAFAALLVALPLLVGAGWGPFRPVLGLINGPTATPQPAPLPLGVFTTYTNATYGYSVQRPSGWVTQVAGGEGENVTFSNYNPAIMYAWPAYPLYQIEIDANENPTKLAPLDYFNQESATYADLHITIISASATTLAGRDAERVVYTEDVDPYPNIEYLVARGDVMFEISQGGAVNGQPSPVFTQMLASLKISG